MLEAAAQKPLFDLFSSLAAKTQLTQRAKLVSDILDGSFLQDTLTKLVKKVDDVLDLGRAERVRHGVVAPLYLIAPLGQELDLA